MSTLVGLSGSPKATATEDERWAAWVAKGAKHDRNVKRRVIVIGSAAVVGLAAWLGIVVLFQ